MEDMALHCETLAHYAAQCGVIVEFGVRIPDETSSTWTFVNAVQQRLVSYDINNCDVGYVAARAAERSVAFEFRRESSFTATIPECDLLMIDAEHTYAAVAQELARHAQQVRRWIILHDTDLHGHVGDNGKEPGLWQAILEFLCANPQWFIKRHVPESFGLTVLEKRA